MRLTELLTRFPSVAPAWNLLGLLQLGSGDPERAQASFSVLADLAGRDIRPHNNLAVCHDAMLRKDWAEVALRRALLLAPGHPVLLRNLMAVLGAGEGATDRADEYRVWQVARDHLRYPSGPP